MQMYFEKLPNSSGFHKSYCIWNAERTLSLFRMIPASNKGLNLVFWIKGYFFIVEIVNAFLKFSFYSRW
jgi:hypothetical protein